MSHHILLMLGRGLHGSEKVLVNHAQLTQHNLPAPSKHSDILISGSQAQLLRSAPFLLEEKEKQYVYFQVFLHKAFLAETSQHIVAKLEVGH